MKENVRLPLLRPELTFRASPEQLVPIVALWPAARVLEWLDASVKVPRGVLDIVAQTCLGGSSLLEYARWAAHDSNGASANGSTTMLCDYSNQQCENSVAAGGKAGIGTTQQEKKSSADSVHEQEVPIIPGWRRRLDSAVAELHRHSWNENFQRIVELPRTSQAECRRQVRELEAFNALFDAEVKATLRACNAI